MGTFPVIRRAGDSGTGFMALNAATNAEHSTPQIREAEGHPRCPQKETSSCRPTMETCSGDVVVVDSQGYNLLLVGQANRNWRLTGLDDVQNLVQPVDIDRWHSSSSSSSSSSR
ncbi:hypothetical protein CLAIMM_05856 [Cladophialophora immunda]|nr:hypothetical protein CLAIMM_05856 [Cladophialophora immunda]